MKIKKLGLLFCLSFLLLGASQICSCGHVCDSHCTYDENNKCTHDCDIAPQDIEYPYG